MTFAEKGLLSYLLSLPDDWDIRVSQIADMFGETERAILRLLKGLIEMGYCKRVPVRKDGRLAGQQYIITDIANNFSAPSKNGGAESAAPQDCSPTENSAPLKNGGAVINNLLFEEDNSYIINKKSEGATAKTRERKCLFEDSKFYDFEKFKAQFTEPEFSDIDILHYYNRLKFWSGSNGQKKIDWIQTAKNWMMRDEEDNKLRKIKTEQPGGMQPLTPEEIEYLNAMSEGL